MTLKSDLKKASYTIGKCSKCGYIVDWVVSYTNGKHDCITKYDPANFVKIKAISWLELKKICKENPDSILDDMNYWLSELEQEETVVEK